MITPTKAYKTSSGKTFDTLEAAQAEEIAAILFPDESTRTATQGDLAAMVVSAKDKILDVLTTKDGSRTRARKINGATRKARTPKIEVAKSI